MFANIHYTTRAGETYKENNVNIWGACAAHIARNFKAYTKQSCTPFALSFIDNFFRVDIENAETGEIVGGGTLQICGGRARWNINF